MSRRTASVFEASSRWNSFSSCRRHSHGHSFLPLRVNPTATKPASPSSTASLFDALDQARFDQVRRAVTASPSALLATSTPRTALAATNSPERLSVVDYALNNCRTWLALIEHCQRTGITTPNMGDLTFRERLAAMSLILVWLLSVPGVPAPKRFPLHTAVSCKFDAVCAALLERHPTLARSSDSRGKTPLHVACSMPAQISPAHAVRYIRMLVNAGADVNARDVEGRTPLHDLVAALNVTTPAYGLVRRRKQTRTLVSVMPTVNELLVHGADVYATDEQGDSPMDVALASGVDYLVLTLRANWVYERICESDYATRVESEDGRCAQVNGLWGTLPDDVVMRIFRLLSPKDVVGGIGATCHGLRRVAVSKHLWNHYAMGYSMVAIRESLWRRGKSASPTRSPD